MPSKYQCSQYKNKKKTKKEKKTKISHFSVGEGIKLEVLKIES